MTLHDLEAPARGTLTSDVLGPERVIAPDDDPFRREFRSWLRDNAPVEPEPSDEDAKFNHRRAWQRAMFAGGWTGPAWPSEFGGRGAGPLHQFMYYEELALARAPQVVNEPGVILLGPTLMQHGTLDLQHRFLPGILSGDDIWCQGFSEPDAGSDLAAIRTKARLEGDEWVIEGHKIWTTWARYADWCFVLCRTEPDTERHRGLSMLICSMKQPGITTRPIHQMSGDSEFGEVFFDSARAPADHIVGERGQGWAAAMTVLQFERSDQGFTDHARLLVELADVATALRAALGEGRLDEPTAAWARSRFAELWVGCQQLRCLNLRAAVQLAGGQQIGSGGSVVKLFWSELLKDIAELSSTVHGAHGLRGGSAVLHRLLASRAASIYSGTSEIQRNVIAERVLGLPR
jgi:alkylation response protein AidB-like acyl-CoA dehydrogenase